MWLRWYGRDAVLKFGRYFSFDEVKLRKDGRVFNRHGSFSTFTSRLIPAVRQFISLPAGLAKMPSYPIHNLYQLLGLFFG